MKTTDKYLNEREVSEMTGLKLPTLRNHRHLKRGIPFHKFEGAVRYSLADVQEYIKRSRVEMGQ